MTEHCMVLFLLKEEKGQERTLLTISAPGRTDLGRRSLSKGQHWAVATEMGAGCGFAMMKDAFRAHVTRPLPVLVTAAPDGQRARTDGGGCTFCNLQWGHSGIFIHSFSKHAFYWPGPVLSVKDVGISNTRGSRTVLPPGLWLCFTHLSSMSCTAPATS